MIPLSRGFAGIATPSGAGIRRTGDVTRRYRRLMPMHFEFESDIWRWDARVAEAWFFATVPAELSEDIREIPRMRRGFGAVRVEARVGDTQWRTSIFPDSGGSYVLPLKKAVRDAESLVEGGTVVVQLEVLDG
jgi:hypothetical protein